MGAGGGEVDRNALVHARRVASLLGGDWPAAPEFDSDGENVKHRAGANPRVYIY
jgi:hypothetical protein